MGSVCVCNNEKEVDPNEMLPEIVKDVKNELIPLDEDNAATTIQHSYKRLKANKKFQNNLEQVIIEKLTNNGEKNYNVEPIPLNEFNEQLKKNPHYEETYSKLKNSLEDIPQNCDDEELTYNMPPLKYVNLDTDETEYYQGTYNIKGELSGKGTLITKENNIYHGNFKKNLFNGKGILLNNEGDYYFGDWKKGDCEGEGKLNCLYQADYEGEFKNNKKNGKGIEHYKDGSTYSGEFVDNLKEGKGKYIFENGAEYTGEFKNNLYDGEGEYKWPDGRTYKGKFKEGLMNGKGIHKWKDGSIYSGNYLNGKKHGQGLYTWPSGKKYYGNWVNNEPHGNGYFEIGPEKYNIVFRFGKIISSKGNKLDNHFEKGDLVKFTRDNIIENNSIRNLDVYFCKKCQNLIDNPVKCTNCNDKYCSACVEDEDKKNIPCINCNGTNYEKDIEILQELGANIKVNCNQCGKELNYNDAIGHRHQNKN